MKKNSIEETIKQLKLMLKVRKEQKDIIECAGGSCINCDPDIKALTESIDILSDYKRVLKENEKYKKAIDVVNKEKADWIRAYQEEKDKQFGFINKMSSKNLILKQEIKNKIKELNKYYKKEIYPELYSWSDLTITEHYDEMIELLQELLKGREE